MKRLALIALAALLVAPFSAAAQRTQKPILHGKHWIAITGKPMAATAGSMMYQRGGNAVDAAAAMLGATATMWDVLSWGGETQALIYHPEERRVIALNALGAAPSGATPEYFREKGYDFPPGSGVDAMVTPGTPGGLMVMLAEWGTLSLAEVLAPAIQMTEGYPVEADAIRRIRGAIDEMKEWPYTASVFFPDGGDGPEQGELLVQADLGVTLQKLVDAEAESLAKGATREEAIMAAYDRFYRGDIAEEYVRGAREQGSTVTMEDLDRWQVYIEEPVMTTYRDVEVYKLQPWVQGPVMNQTLNILENFDLQEMGYNSARYIHTLYQAMNMAFADRDFYYGDIYFPPEEPTEGLLSKEYARHRAEQMNHEENDAEVVPGDPYPFQGGVNPFTDLLEQWVGGGEVMTEEDEGTPKMEQFLEDFYQGTTSIQAADESGWVVSITPSGGWIPAVIAGNTGIGMSQRAQSFVIDEVDGPFNVIEPGKRPRATLTPGMALKDGRPYLSFAVQGGDSQDQNLVQFLLNMVEFDMNVQQAVEAANMNSMQLRGSFGSHATDPGGLLLQSATPPWVQAELRSMGYDIRLSERTSGPINAIFFDWDHGSFWGGSSHHGDDYGVVWE